MKKTNLIAVLLISAPLAIAEGDHDHGDHKHHDHKPNAGHHHDDHVKAGPNGGHVVKSSAGITIEVAVDKERIARITVLDDHGKAAAPAEVQIEGIAGARSNPVKLAFAVGKGEDAAVLISDKALPAGEHIPMVLVIKKTADAKPVTERFELHLH